MAHSVRTSLTLISLLLLCSATRAYCQQSLVPQPGEKVRYKAMIEMPRAYLSGVCILLNDTSVIKGSIFNEMGVSAIDFSYVLANSRLRLHHVMGAFDKWYIKRTLRKDLLALLRQMENGASTYHNNKRHLTYTLTPMQD